MESPPGPTEKGTESKKMKTDPPRILYVLTPYCFSAIHLNEQEQKSVDTGEWPPTPVSVAEVHLEMGLPIEMGMFKNKSDIFLFGGSRFITSTNLYPDLLPKLDVMEINGYSVDGYPIPKSKDYEIEPGDFFPNLDVIKFLRPCGGFIRAENIPKMEGYKSRPTVAQVGHKILCIAFAVAIYVFNVRSLSVTIQTLENGRYYLICCILHTKMPFALVVWQIMILLLSAIKSSSTWWTILLTWTILLMNLLLIRKPFIVLILIRKKWDETSAVSLVNSFVEAGLRLPHRARSFSGLKSHSQNLSLIVYSQYEKEETLSFGLIEKSGCLRLHEELKLNVPLFGGYSPQVLQINKECIVDLEDGCHMCLIVSTFVKAPPQNPASHAYYICIFEVKILLDDDLLLDACNGKAVHSLRSL